MTEWCFISPKSTSSCWPPAVLQTSDFYIRPCSSKNDIHHSSQLTAACRTGNEGHNKKKKHYKNGNCLTGGKARSLLMLLQWHSDLPLNLLLNSQPQFSTLQRQAWMRGEGLKSHQWSLLEHNSNNWNTGDVMIGCLPFRPVMPMACHSRQAISSCGQRSLLHTKHDRLHHRNHQDS